MVSFSPDDARGVSRTAECGKTSVLYVVETYKGRGGNNEAVEESEEWAIVLTALELPLVMALDSSLSGDGQEEERDNDDNDDDDVVDDEEDERDIDDVLLLLLSRFTNGQCPTPLRMSLFS